MRGNRVKEKLKRGDVAIAVGGHSNTSDTIDFLGPLGFDGIWLEGEHGSVTWRGVGDLSRACDLWGMSSLARLHQNDPGVITRTLDLGVNSIVVPHVSTRAEAEQVVESAFFAPVGRRGIFEGRRSYGASGASDFYRQANLETLVIVLIEEIQAVENLDEILAVDHIDVFFVAPGDLAQTMGMVGKQRSPKVEAVVEEAIQQIVASGRTAGALGYEDKLQHYSDLGVRFFLTFYDRWFKEAARGYLNRVASVRPG